MRFVVQASSYSSATPFVAKYAPTDFSTAARSSASALFTSHADQSRGSSSASFAIISSDATRALPPRRPNDTHPSRHGQISRVRPTFAPRRRPRFFDRAYRPAAPMFAIDTTSCIDTSTSTGRLPDASALIAANAASGAVCANAASPAQRTGGRSGSPVAHRLPEAAITPRSDARHDDRGPSAPNGVTLTQTAPGAAPTGRGSVLSTTSALSTPFAAEAPRSRNTSAAVASGASSPSTATRTPSRNGADPLKPDTSVRLLLGSMTFRIVSADAHVLEPPHIWETWLPKQYQDKAPVLAKDADGGDAWQFAGSADPDPIGLGATRGMGGDDFGGRGVTYAGARPGCYDGRARMGDMDIAGVDAGVLFPPQRTIGHF